jgi:hypothetical protein
MRRTPWLLAVVSLVSVVACGSRGQTDQTPLALRIAERYGRTDLVYSTANGHRRLELTLSDKRWNGLNDVVPDSARAIARYALDDLMGFERPDTIVVTIQSTSRLGGTVTGSTGVHLATADL